MEKNGLLFDEQTTLLMTLPRVNFQTPLIAELIASTSITLIMSDKVLL